MTKTVIHVIGFLIVIGISKPVDAQFVNLQLEIEPELSATVKQELDFGTQVTNSGRTEVNLGDANMGVFSIRAYHTQNVYLNLQYPDELTHSNPAIDQHIPLELSLSYNNSGNDQAYTSRPLPANNGLVAIYENLESQIVNDIWKELYIYVYGAITVGNIPNGEYTGDIVLSVDYD